jgi:hypothetical protein
MITYATIVCLMLLLYDLVSYDYLCYYCMSYATIDMNTAAIIWLLMLLLYDYLCYYCMTYHMTNYATIVWLMLLLYDYLCNFCMSYALIICIMLNTNFTFLLCDQFLGLDIGVFTTYEQFLEIVSVEVLTKILYVMLRTGKY